MTFNSARQPINPFNLLSESLSQVAPAYLSLLMLNVPSVFINLLPQFMPATTAISISLLYIILITPIIGAIGMCFIHRYLKQQTLDIGGAFSQAIGKSGLLILGMLFLILSCTLGIILLVVPGIYLLVVWGFSLYAIAMDNYSLVDSFKYSYQLVKGRWWPVLGSMLVGALLVIPATIVSAVITPKPASFGTGGAIVASLISSIISILLAPVLQMYYVKLYLRLQDTDNLGSKV